MGVTEQRVPEIDFESRLTRPVVWISLTRIRNANSVNKATVSMPSSKLVEISFGFCKK